MIDNTNIITMGKPKSMGENLAIPARGLGSEGVTQGKTVYNIWHHQLPHDTSLTSQSASWTSPHDLVPIIYKNLLLNINYICIYIYLDSA